ncbi:MAG: hypothetical protein Tsb0020_01970 [Haliangiales bacterium]
MPRILIVDDEQLVRNALRRALRGYETVTAANGAEALDCLDKSPAPFDLILCDLMMPNVSGIDLYRHLCERRPGCEKQLVFLTGGVFTDEARDFLDEISNRVVQKPFDVRKLRTIVKDTLLAGADEEASRPAR